LKIKYKITLLFTLLVTAILLLVNSFIYYVSSEERQTLFNNRLKGRANNDAQLYSLFKDSSESILRKIDVSSMLHMVDKSVVIYNERDEIIYQFHSDQESITQFSKNQIELAKKYGENYFAIGDLDALTYYHTDTSHKLVVGIAAYDEYGYDRLAQLRKVLITTLLFGVFIAAFAGLIFSRQLLVPLASIIRTVRNISTNDLNKRIPVKEPQDELGLLSKTFNELLDSIQQSFNIQRRFISNASHELSTPLTSMSSQLEIILQKERSDEEYKQVLRSLQEDILHLRMLTKSLLEMAKAGSQGAIELVEVRIDEVLFRVIADVHKINPLFEATLDFGELPEDEQGFLVFGNPELLYSSFKNLVENACKYSNDHQAYVVLNAYKDGLSVSIQNNGDVIPESDIENLFQPFYRREASMNIKGFGLGLSLTKRIIRLHKGYIKVISNTEEGTVFTVELPNTAAFNR
jgi:two-component system sensor histidine kinase ArlS